MQGGGDTPPCRMPPCATYSVPRYVDAGGCPRGCGWPYGQNIWTADFRRSSSIASGMCRRSPASNRMCYAIGNPNSAACIPARIMLVNGSMSDAMSSWSWKLRSCSMSNVIRSLERKNSWLGETSPDSRSRRQPKGPRTSRKRSSYALKNCVASWRF